MRRTRDKRVIAAVQKVVEDHIDLYGSTGKAKP
jgi:hypothetical protein